MEIGGSLFDEEGAKIVPEIMAKAKVTLTLTLTLTLNLTLTLTQAMRSAPFVKPFELRMREWETKLVSMQEIIDEWLKCQSVWLYLEPIFASEDIMRQMPTEAKRFTQVALIPKPQPQP